ncbi:hypothetical protein DUI87_05906 [Hirundo rustica rustica]|uniref:Uncharacterized protein n=1 Tax=Hirundo rustica rustica TaxID=333673 RepID=A0A3M0KVZ3_HIRRU|nr:hypothetical protein DUI87_05906 [Hirundo rustica rustica]
MWRSQVVFSKQTPRFSLLFEPVLKAQDSIYSTNRTDDWGYRHHKVTLGQYYCWFSHDDDDFAVVSVAVQLTTHLLKTGDFSKASAVELVNPSHPEDLSLTVIL